MKRRTIGTTLLILGTVLGMILASLALWAEIEARQYGFLRFTRTQLTSLRCPVFINPEEHLPIQARVTNRRAKYRGQFTVRITKSAPGIFEQQTERFRLSPGESRTLRWEVGPENIDLDHFIFVDVYQFGSYPNEPRQSQCGIFVLPVPWLSGTTFLWGGLLLTLALLWGGWALWRTEQADWEINPAVRFGLNSLALLVPLTLVVAFWGNWLLGAPLVMVLFLAVFGILLYSGLRLE